MASIREIADELGVSKQTIRRKLDAGFRREHVSAQGNRLLVDAEGVELLRAEISNDQAAEKRNTKTQHRNTESQQESQQRNSQHRNSGDAVVALQEQLVVKDQQIERLQTLLDQSQRLQLQTQTQLVAANKRLENATDKRNTKRNTERNSQQESQRVSDEDDLTQQRDEIPKQGWFARLFGRK